RPAPATASAWSTALPYDALLPSGFADFDAAAPLDGSLLPARLDRADGDGLALTVAGRSFALVAAGDGGEWRFSGWSEQRTLAPGPDGGLLLRVRRGRALADRHVPAQPRTP